MLVLSLNLLKIIILIHIEPQTQASEGSQELPPEEKKAQKASTGNALDAIYRLIVSTERLLLLLGFTARSACGNMVEG